MYASGTGTGTGSGSGTSSAGNEHTQTDGDSPTTNPIYRTYLGPKPFYDSASQSYVFQTKNVKKHSNTYYYTMLWEFSRIKPGVDPETVPISQYRTMSALDPHYYVGGEREYVCFNIDQLNGVEAVIADQVTVCTYIIPLETLLARIEAYDPIWRTEIEEIREAGEVAYVGVDASIGMAYDGVPSILEMVDQTTGQAHYIRRGSRGIAYRWNNYTQLASIGWSNPNTYSDIANTHYNMVLPIGEPKPEKVEIPDVEPIQTPSGTMTLIKNRLDGDTNTTKAMADDLYAAPTIYTYNTDSDYHLYEGIPTTETYTNGIDVDSWYGHVGITEKHPQYKVTVDYDVMVTYYKTTLVNVTGSAGMAGQTINTGSSTITFGPGNGTTSLQAWIKTPYQREYTGPYTYVFEGTYYYINEINLRQFDQADVKEIQYDGSGVSELTSWGPTHYDTDKTIQYHIVADNGKEVSSAAGTYLSSTGIYSTPSSAASDKAHVRIPKIEDSERKYTNPMTYTDAEEPPPDDWVRNNVIKDVNEMFENRKVNGSDTARRMEVYNDELELDNVVYMTRQGSSKQYNPSESTNFPGGLFTPNSLRDIGTSTSDSVELEQDVTVPEKQKNGLYYTQLRTYYRRMAAGAGNRELTLTDTPVSDPSWPPISPEPDQNGGGTYKQNEPIRVHSPVISPMHIDGEENAATGGKQTQLIRDPDPAKNGYDETAGAQLILDNTYTLKFDWHRYFLMKGYDLNEIGDDGTHSEHEPGWITFVQDKQVRFPFPVKYDGNYYEIGADGYTEWFSVGVVKEFDFYLPTWALEGVYGDSNWTGYNAYDRPIQCKVFANNFDPGQDQIAEEYEWNEQDQSYVATYDFPVQVSGIIYDFTVQSVNDEERFGGFDYDTGVYRFSKYGEEKKVGNRNRFGEPYIRLFESGLVESNWKDSNTLPFVNGKSNALREMGYLVPGSKIGFYFRTISSLWNNNDTVVITPEYRYIADDGTVYGPDKISLYYNAANSNFITPNTDADRYNIQSVQLGSLWHEQDLYDFRHYDAAQFTADTYGETWHQRIFRKTDSSTFGGITLYSTQKLLYGNEEELEVNQAKDGAAVERYNGLNGTPLLDTIGDSSYQQFKKSMQTWFGTYQIPNDLFVCLKNPSGSEYADKYQEEIGKNGFIPKVGADCWLKGGFLVLNFKIETYMNGVHKHLTYYGNAQIAQNQDMWDIEHGTEPDRVTANWNHDVSINLKDGDVAIICMNEKMSDRWGIGILYLN